MRFVIIPETGSGKGTGHLVRCLDLAACLPGAELCVPPDRLEDLSRRYPALRSLKTCSPGDFGGAAAAGGQCYFIYDKPLASEPEILGLLHHGSVVGIDSIGPGLRRIPYVVDLLPRLRSNRSWRRANRDGRRYLDLPPRRREPPAPGDIRRVLVAFGGEDPAGLRRRLIESGALAACLPRAEVTLLEGPRMPELGVEPPAGWRRLEALPRLRDRLHEWDLVVTSFGLTAYEARQAGCRVVLVNPAGYHQRLGRRDGFSSAGVGKVRAGSFRRALRAAPAAAFEREGGPDQSGPRALARWLLGLGNPGDCACPGCRSRGNQVIARLDDRSFYRCGHCGLDYQQLFGEQTVSYNEAYFFEEYQRQYGKTYLEDFDHIKAMGKIRLDRMEDFGTVRPGARLLDVGCAYGPFLAAAKERGMAAHGIDISPEAAGWVSANLGLPAVAGDIRELEPRTLGGAFDLVTLWYVVEHFPDLHRVLVALNELLEMGGVLALGTPSGSGVSARFRPLSFLQASPRDHYSIWRPAMAARLLRLHGFRLDGMVVTGHHPERFPGPLGRPWLRPAMAKASLWFRLGDTFEIYATKVGHPQSISKAKDD